MASEPDPRLTAHKRPALLATAALVEVLGHARALEAAVLRDASQDEQELIRHKARDTLESYLDLTAEAAQAVRALAP